MNKAWLEMNGDELWLGRAAEMEQAQYCRVSDISAMSMDRGAGKTHVVCAGAQFFVDQFGLRPVDIFNAIRWYRKELAEGRAPGTHVIEGARDVDRDLDEIKRKTLDEMAVHEKTAPRPPVVTIEIPSADSITGGKSIRDTLRDMGVEDDD